MEENKIDRNQIIGFVLIGIIMLWFAYWSSNQAPEAEEQTESSTTEVVEEKPLAETGSPIVPAAEAMEIDSLQTESEVKDSIFTLENELLKIQISSGGAQIVGVELKKFQTWDSLPLTIVDSNQILAFRVGEQGSTLQHRFTGVVNSANEGQSLALKSSSANGQQFEIKYSLPANSYQLQAKVKGSGFVAGANLYADWQLDAIRTEKNIDTERQKATIYWWQKDESDYISPRSDGDKEKEGLTWVGYKQHFFSSVFHPKQQIESSRMATLNFEGETLSKRMKSESRFASVDGSFDLDFNLYYGPNKYNVLKDIGSGYHEIIDFGWGIFGWISRGVVIPIFNWLDKYGLNYGLIIFIMALIIKIALFPLTYQSYKSMAKMRVLKPEMDVINEKFKDKDPVKKNQAVMELYQQAGVNPLGGCIPMLVQMPILLAMFNFFPASIELRQKSFLWANDLSSYDAIVSWDTYIPVLSSFYGNHISLFTVLMTISTLVYTWMNSQMQGQTNQIPGMKFIMYGMPVMLLFWFNSYSAGLSYYYFVANIITFSQQWLIRKSMDDDAIHAKIQAKRAQPKKKSTFQTRLEEMAKQQGKKLPK